MKYIALILASLMALGTFTVPHPKTVDFKLAMLCHDNPQEDCKQLQDYCREALELGHECYITN